MFSAVAAGIPSFGDLAWKAPVALATIAALPAHGYANGVMTATANGAFPVIDGFNAGVGDRLLVRFGAPASDQGIYTVTDLGSAGSKWVLTRATDCDSAAEMVAGLTTLVLFGTLLGGTVWTALNAWTPTSGLPGFSSTLVSWRNGSATVTGSSTGNPAVLNMQADATATPEIDFWSGSVAPDARLIRLAAKVLTLDDAAGGPADLAVLGLITSLGGAVWRVGAGVGGTFSGRQAVGAAIAAGGSRTDTVNLPAGGYADTSYTISVTPRAGAFATGVVSMEVSGAPGTTSFVVATVNGDSVARTPTIHWLTVHD